MEPKDAPGEPIVFHFRDLASFVTVAGVLGYLCANVGRYLSLVVLGIRYRADTAFPTSMPTSINAGDVGFAFLGVLAAVCAYGLASSSKQARSFVIKAAFITLLALYALLYVAARQWIQLVIAALVALATGVGTQWFGRKIAARSAALSQEEIARRADSKARVSACWSSAMIGILVTTVASLFGTWLYPLQRIWIEPGSEARLVARADSDGLFIVSEGGGLTWLPIKTISSARSLFPIPKP